MNIYYEYSSQIWGRLLKACSWLVKSRTDLQQGITLVPPRLWSNSEAAKAQGTSVVRNLMVTVVSKLTACTGNSWLCHDFSRPINIILLLSTVIMCINHPISIKLVAIVPRLVAVTIWSRRSVKTPNSSLGTTRTRLGSLHQKCLQSIVQKRPINNRKCSLRFYALSLLPFFKYHQAFFIYL